MTDEKLNLTQEWDKVFPKSDKVDHKKVTFHNRYGITLAADLYTPKNAVGKLPAIAVSGPFGAVKEQSSGLYAQKMAEYGYLTIAFDPSYTGESGGQPRYVASPDINTEDFCAAADFLSVQENVDPERIGIIGICGWGGMAVNAAAQDTRIKATAAMTMYDTDMYLAVSDPLDAYDVELKDLIANDDVPYFDEVSQIRFAGSEDYSVIYDEDGKSICADDIYFTADGKPLDTSRVNSYISVLRYLELTDYVTYRVTDEELSAYGLDDPELSVSVDYTDDGTSDTFVLHISRDPAEKKSAADAEDEEASDITAYARVGDSKIIYQISGSSYRSLMAAGYNDLRHQEIFSGNFDDVTGIDVTLDGETYTLTAQKDGKERTWLCGEAEIKIGDLQDALEALTAEEFTSEEATGQQEISLTLHLDHEDEPELAIVLYRCDGSKCLAVVDGKSVAYVPRGEMVTLAEAVRVIALN